MHEPIQRTWSMVGPVFIVSAIILVCCSRRVEAPEPGVVADIEGDVITGEDLRERFWQGTQEERLKSQQRGGRHFLLEKVIEDRLLVHEARRRMLSPTYSDVETFHRTLMQRFLTTEFEPTVSPESIPDDEVRAEYERLGSELEVPERRLIRIMVQPSRERAEEIIALIASKVSVGDAAGVYTLLQDTSLGEKGGGKGLFTREEAVQHLDEDLIDIVFHLDSSEITHDEPVKFRGRWAIVAVEEVHEHRPAPPLEEVEAQIRQRLFREAREKALNAFVDSFRKSHKVVVNDAFLELVPWTAISTNSGEQPAEAQDASSQK